MIRALGSFGVAVMLAGAGGVPVGFEVAPALAQCGAADRPVIAEVFYDAAGDDAGVEFVELLNRGDLPVALAGVRLEAGNGSAPGSWTVRWIAASRDTILAHARFVIGGAQVEPAPDTLVALDLQNGPDAVRLVWPDGVIEVVGYGAQEFGEYACGAPAEDAPPGFAVARIPDDARAGSNALDFRVAPPTPGRANQPRRDAAVIAGSLTLDPEQPAVATPARARAAIVARGALGFATGEVALDVVLAGTPLATVTLAAPLAPAETTTVEISVTVPAAGAGVLVARVRAALDEDPGDDADSLRVRVGPGPLEVTEIQFHPARGEGEWVELRNRDALAVDLSRFMFGDRSAARGSVSAHGRVELAPGALAVVVQDRARFLTAFPALDTARVFAVSPWAALNNTDDDAGIADVVTVRERDGTPCTREPFHSGGIPSGVPLERGEAGTWGPSSDPCGTPLGPPVRLPVLERSFVAAPRKFAAVGVPVRLEWSLPWPAVRLEVIAYDLAGRRAAVVLPPAEAPARGATTWQPALTPGVYVLALAARSARGASLAAAEPVRVTGREP